MSMDINCFCVLRFRLPVLLLSTALTAAPLVLHAQSNASSSPTVDAGASATKNYWTPDRLINAQPAEPHPGNIGTNGLPAGAEMGAKKIAPTQGEEPVYGQGAPPSVGLERNSGEMLLQPGDLPEPNQQIKVGPTATSSYGAYLTTTRVFP